MSVNAVRIEAALEAGTGYEKVLNFTLDVHSWPQSEAHTAVMLKSQVLQNVAHDTWDIITAL